jgi:hypothetical protein
VHALCTVAGLNVPTSAASAIMLANRLPSQLHSVAVGLLVMLQAAVEDIVLACLNVPAGPCTAASTSPHPPLAGLQLRHALHEGDFGLNVTEVAPDSNAVEYQCASSLHAASILTAAADGHDTIPGVHPFLPPFLHLHFASAKSHAVPSPSLCVRL